MKKVLRKITALSVSVILALGMLSISSSAASVSVDKTSTVYLTSKSGTGYASIYVTGTNKFTSVSSSNTSVASISGASGWTDAYSSYDASLKETYSGTSKGANINLTTKKAGTTTVKFKTGGKSYSTTLTVKSYTNPAKSIKISGVNSGKNLKSKLNNSASYSGLKVAKKTKSATIKVTAAKGWKVTSISLTNQKTSARYSYTRSSNPTKSATLRVGTLKTGTPYTVDITFLNTSNNATINVYYYIS